MTVTDTKSYANSVGYRAEFDYLYICPVCFGLYEEGRPDGQNQCCGCQPDDERWDGFDYNCRAMLCLCCALVPLRSGSRWSPYFCDKCRSFVMAVSIWERRLIFPIGPHSIMHGWVPEAVTAIEGLDPDPPYDEFIQTTHALLSGHDVLRRWYRMAMPWQLNALGLQAPVSLRDYVDAARDQEQSAPLTTVDAFKELCLYARTGATTLDPGGFVKS